MVIDVLKIIGAVCCMPIYGIGYVMGFMITLVAKGCKDGEDRVDSNW